jgi:hypothetical protein
VKVAALVTLDLRPWWFTAIINLLFTALFLVQLIQTALFGGLLDSGLVVAFGLLIVLAALLATGIQALPGGSLPSSRSIGARET